MTKPEINGKYYIHIHSEYQYCGVRYHAGVLDICRVIEKVDDLYRVSFNDGTEMLVTEQRLMPILSRSYRNTIRKQNTQNHLWRQT